MKKELLLLKNKVQYILELKKKLSPNKNGDLVYERKFFINVLF